MYQDAVLADEGVGGDPDIPDDPSIYLPQEASAAETVDTMTQPISEPSIHFVTFDPAAEFPTYNCTQQSIQPVSSCTHTPHTPTNHNPSLLLQVGHDSDHKVQSFSSNTEATLYDSASEASNYETAEVPAHKLPLQPAQPVVTVMDQSEFENLPIPHANDSLQASPQPALSSSDPECPVLTAETYPSLSSVNDFSINNNNDNPSNYPSLNEDNSAPTLTAEFDPMDTCHDNPAAVTEESVPEANTDDMFGSDGSDSEPDVLSLLVTTINGPHERIVPSAQPASSLFKTWLKSTIGGESVIDIFPTLSKISGRSEELIKEATHIPGKDPDLTSNNNWPEPPKQVEDAMSYINKIKDTYKTHPGTFTKFLSLLRVFKQNKISLDNVMNQIKELFTDNAHLIAGFDHFLPPNKRKDKPEALEGDCVTPADMFCLLFYGHKSPALPLLVPRPADEVQYGYPDVENSYATRSRSVWEEDEDLNRTCSEMDDDSEESQYESEYEEVEVPVKRGRGRPRKYPILDSAPAPTLASTPGRGRGRGRGRGCSGHGRGRGSLGMQAAARLTSKAKRIRIDEERVKQYAQAKGLTYEEARKQEITRIFLTRRMMSNNAEYANITTPETSTEEPSTATSDTNESTYTNDSNYTIDSTQSRGRGRGGSRGKRRKRPKDLDDDMDEEMSRREIQRLKSIEYRKTPHGIETNLKYNEVRKRRAIEKRAQAYSKKHKISFKAAEKIITNERELSVAKREASLKLKLKTYAKEHSVSLKVAVIHQEERKKKSSLQRTTLLIQHNAQKNEIIRLRTRKYAAENGMHFEDARKIIMEQLKEERFMKTTARSKIEDSDDEDEDEDEDDEDDYSVNSVKDEPLVRKKRKYVRRKQVVAEEGNTSAEEMQRITDERRKKKFGFKRHARRGRPPKNKPVSSESEEDDDADSIKIKFEQNQKNARRPSRIQGAQDPKFMGRLTKNDDAQCSKNVLPLIRTDMRNNLTDSKMTRTELWRKHLCDVVKQHKKFRKPRTKEFGAKSDENNKSDKGKHADSYVKSVDSSECERSSLRTYRIKGTCIGNPENNKIDHKKQKSTLISKSLDQDVSSGTEPTTIHLRQRDLNCRFREDSTESEGLSNKKVGSHRQLKSKNLKSWYIRGHDGSSESEEEDGKEKFNKPRHITNSRKQSFERDKMHKKGYETSSESNLETNQGSHAKPKEERFTQLKRWKSRNAFQDKKRNRSSSDSEKQTASKHYKEDDSNHRSSRNHAKIPSNDETLQKKVQPDYKIRKKRFRYSSYRKNVDSEMTSECYNTSTMLTKQRDSNLSLIVQGKCQPASATSDENSSFIIQAPNIMASPMFEEFSDHLSNKESSMDELSEQGSSRSLSHKTDKSHSHQVPACLQKAYIKDYKPGEQQVVMHEIMKSNVPYVQMLRGSTINVVLLKQGTIEDFHIKVLHGEDGQNLLKKLQQSPTFKCTGIVKTISDVQCPKAVSKLLDIEKDKKLEILAGTAHSNDGNICSKADNAPDHKKKICDIKVGEKKLTFENKDKRNTTILPNNSPVSTKSMMETPVIGEGKTNRLDVSGHQSNEANIKDSIISVIISHVPSKGNKICRLDTDSKKQSVEGRRAHECLTLPDDGQIKQSTITRPAIDKVTTDDGNVKDSNVHSNHGNEQPKDKIKDAETNNARQKCGADENQSSHASPLKNKLKCAKTEAKNLAIPDELIRDEVDKIHLDSSSSVIELKNDKTELDGNTLSSTCGDNNDENNKKSNIMSESDKLSTGNQSKGCIVLQTDNHSKPSAKVSNKLKTVDNIKLDEIHVTSDIQIIRNVKDNKIPSSFDNSLVNNKKNLEGQTDQPSTSCEVVFGKQLDSEKGDVKDASKCNSAEMMQTSNDEVKSVEVLDSCHHNKFGDVKDRKARNASTTALSKPPVKDKVKSTNVTGTSREGKVSYVKGTSSNVTTSDNKQYSEVEVKFKVMPGAHCDAKEHDDKKRNSSNKSTLANKEVPTKDKVKSKKVSDTSDVTKVHRVKDTKALDKPATSSNKPAFKDDVKLTNVSDTSCDIKLTQIKDTNVLIKPKISDSKRLSTVEVKSTKASDFSCDTKRSNVKDTNVSRKSKAEEKRSSKDEEKSKVADPKGSHNKDTLNTTIADKKQLSKNSSTDKVRSKIDSKLSNVNNAKTSTKSTVGENKQLSKDAVKLMKASVTGPEVKISDVKVTIALDKSTIISSYKLQTNNEIKSVKMSDTSHATKVGKVNDAVKVRKSTTADTKRPSKNEVDSKQAPVETPSYVSHVKDTKTTKKSTNVDDKQAAKDNITSIKALDTSQKTSNLKESNISCKSNKSSNKELPKDGVKLSRVLDTKRESNVSDVKDSKAHEKAMTVKKKESSKVKVSPKSVTPTKYTIIEHKQLPEVELKSNLPGKHTNQVKSMKPSDTSHDTMVSYAKESNIPSKGIIISCHNKVVVDNVNLTQALGASCDSMVSIVRDTSVKSGSAPPKTDEHKDKKTHQSSLSGTSADRDTLVHEQTMINKSASIHVKQSANDKLKPGNLVDASSEVKIIQVKDSNTLSKVSCSRQIADKIVSKEVHDTNAPDKLTMPKNKHEVNSKQLPGCTLRDVPCINTPSEVTKQQTNNKPSDDELHKNRPNTSGLDRDLVNTASSKETRINISTTVDKKQASYKVKPNSYDKDFNATGRSTTSENTRPSGDDMKSIEKLSKLSIDDDKSKPMLGASCVNEVSIVNDIKDQTHGHCQSTKKDKTCSRDSPRPEDEVWVLGASGDSALCNVEDSNVRTRSDNKQASKEELKCKSQSPANRYSRLNTVGRRMSEQTTTDDSEVDKKQVAKTQCGHVSVILCKDTRLNKPTGTIKLLATDLLKCDKVRLKCHKFRHMKNSRLHSRRASVRTKCKSELRESSNTASSSESGSEWSCAGLRKERSLSIRSVGDIGQRSDDMAAPCHLSRRHSQAKDSNVQSNKDSDTDSISSTRPHKVFGRRSSQLHSGRERAISVSSLPDSFRNTVVKIAIVRSPECEDLCKKLPLFSPVLTLDVSKSKDDESALCESGPRNCIHTND